MNRTQKIAILLTVLIVLTAIAAVLLVEYRNSLGPQFPFSQPREHSPYQADFEFFYMAHTIFSTVNIVLTTLLIISYLIIYQKTRSEFPLILSLFAMMLLVKDITLSPFVIMWGGFGLFGLGPFAFLPDIFEMAALLVLFYLSVKY